PVGDYTELEGTEDGILALAGRLGFAPEQFIRDSYHALYVQYCQERGTPPQQMVFRQTETETDNR
ncbi:MAG: hypothetical protein LBP68_07140, partial [Acidobacteriota bacterium]|nr:hypothetical protein [Acidobacteriota bacterium]